jgi:hypothetical protein
MLHHPSIISGVDRDAVQLLQLHESAEPGRDCWPVADSASVTQSIALQLQLGWYHNNIATDPGSGGGQHNGLLRFCSELS